MTRTSWKDFNVEREWLGKSFNLSEVTAMRTGRQAKMRTQDINGQKLYVNCLTKTIWDRVEGEVVLNIGGQRMWQSDTSSDLSTIIPLIHPFKISIWHHSHCEQTWNFLQQQCSKVCCVWRRHQKWWGKTRARKIAKNKTSLSLTWEFCQCCIGIKLPFQWKTMVGQIKSTRSNVFCSVADWFVPQLLP